MDLSKSRFLLSLALAVAVTAAVACGSDKKESSSSQQTVATTAAQEVRTPAAGQYTAAPREQQIFRVAWTQPEFLDPHKSNFAQDIAVERLLSRPLFWVDEKGSPVPSVAREMPTRQNNGISADGKTYTIKLKDNQKFSDGSLLTAKDFEYSIKRALHPKLASLYASELYNIAGAEALNTAKDANADQIKTLWDAVGVRAIDNGTLEFKLNNPQPTITQILGMWMAYPVKQAAVEQGGAPIENTDWAFDPARSISNGPFVLKEYREKDRIVVEANPNYTLEPKPKLFRIEMRISEDEEVSFNAFQTAELDYAAVPTSKIPLVDGDPNLKKQNIRAPDPTVFWLIPNHGVKPLDNQKVRQALAKAIDRDAFVKAVLGGVGESTTLFMYPSVPGADKSDGDSLKYDPSAAKQLLADAGYANGQGFPTLTFLSSQATVAKNSAEFIQKQLKDNLNVTINLEVVDARTRSSRYNNKQFDLALGGWHEDYHDPENWLPTLLESTSTNNKWNYKNQQFDDLVRQAKYELDEQKRVSLYRQAHKVALDDAAVGPVYNRTRNAVIATKVKGIEAHPLDSMFAGNILVEKIEIARE
jgi:oligopeptide transport system substrate-binding protein